ncbi:MULTISPECIES: YpdA family putative bacillithiol disulfide reductase [unclassified Paenibacillus]|uniref:YpdA family putative bacillithiol disulfide reductase n=1 Tax=unclassified Paenibacillus TaxID=185978 RepID=UPI001AE7F21E|nr:MULTISPECIES: YpdA family putative bacillithiol disulfide reductase [unclassified Paenibacillus]MBP1155637.1 thioredoxin reductase (NADPH) [Paenibacillus sp. PvP091]MBP1168977.1 thioredoxin reductase (NADPH) [Paenibacillus sp. PvR098]MBP2440005.1 thioredoxin reductase (NADPH) [Paenibacillus sp. PvP052]
MEDVIVIGAGPCGLSTALELQRIGLNPLVIEKECVVHSIYLYPTYMQFFSTPELLEIGGFPFSTPNDKPYRLEALNYYRSVAQRNELRIRSYETVTEISRQADSTFELTVQNRFGSSTSIQARRVVVATGYFDHPNILGIPGEDLPNVTHYFREAHPYTGTRVAVIGGSNSAIDAAMELLRAGASVTVIYRGEQYSSVIKPWVLPIFESMVSKGRIRMLFRSRVTHISESEITVVTDGQEQRLDIDFVLALTGFRPDRGLLTKAGAELNVEADGVPKHDPGTMETTVPGLYIAGVAASGSNANEVFIETGRLHGGRIAAHIASRS